MSRHFGAYADEALRVMACESGGDPAAVSPDGANLGLFQINRIHMPKFDGAHPLDPEANVRVAAQIWRDNGGWGPWSCRPY